MEGPGVYKMHRTSFLFLLFSAALLCSCERPFEAFVLLEKNQPCTIVVDISPHSSFEAALAKKDEESPERQSALLAAQELRHYLATMMSIPERQISIVGDDQAISGRVLLLGMPGNKSAYTDVRKKLQKWWKRTDPHHKGLIRMDAGYQEERQWLALTAQQPSTILDAVYAFLEQQGVAWYAPGERDVYVPAQRQIRVSQAAVIKEPALQMRGFFPDCPDDGKPPVADPAWMTWWLRQHVHEIPANWANDHSILTAYGMRAVRSSRQVPLAGWQPGFCAANDSVVAALVKNIRPVLAYAQTYVLDGQQALPLCSCAACQALGNESSRLVGLLNALGHALAEAQKQGIVPGDRRLIGIVPVKPPDQPLPQDWPAAQVTLALQMQPRCYNHSIDDPSCTEVNVPLQAFVTAWLKQAANADVAVVEGYYASEFAGLPLVFDHVLNRDLAAYRAMGVAGIYGAAPNPSMPGMQGYLNYMYSQSAWNGRMRVDSLRDGYFSAHYPGTSSGVREYYDMTEEAMANITAWRFVMSRRIRELQQNGFAGALLPLPGFAEHFNLYQTFSEKNDGVDWERTFQLVHDMRHVMDDLLDKNTPDQTLDRLLLLEKQLQFADLTIGLYDNMIRTLTLGADEPEMREEAAIRLREVVKKMAAFEMIDGACGQTSALEQSGIAEACQELLSKLEKEYGVPYQRVYEE